MSHGSQNISDILSKMEQTTCPRYHGNRILEKETRMERKEQCHASSSRDYSEESEREGLFWNTYNTIKSGFASIIPSLYYSMTCKALIQESGNSRSFGIVVLVCQSHQEKSEGHNTELIGRTLRPKMVKAGCLRVRLVSNDFEPDTCQGEQPDMVKTEPCFRGQEFEKQFACKYKLGPVKEGILGKVIVDHVTDSGKSTPVFEFNLSRGVNTWHSTPTPVPSTKLFPVTPSTPLNSSVTSESARRPIEKIAESLNINQANNWRILARHLGLSPREINRLGNAPVPLTSVLSAYKSRGGSDDDFIQSMYDVSRRITPPKPKTSTPCCSPEMMFGVRRRLFLTAHDSNMTQTTFSLESDDEEDEETDEEYLSAISRADTFPLIDNGVLPLTSSPYTITPPNTPLKRTSSETGSSPLPSPSKRLRTVFTFSEEEKEEQRLEQVCQQDLNDSVLWQLSCSLTKDWKHVCRSLEIPETELYIIEHSHKDLRERAYQALLRWRDMYPQNSTYKTLYLALCQNGMRAQAMKYCLQ